MLMKPKQSSMDSGVVNTTTHHRRTSTSTTSAGGGGGAGEFFICFTARHSSSCKAATVMRVPSSKSLMSPARSHHLSSSVSSSTTSAAAAAAPAPSLSASLSRRLRSSGSVRGLQSPMFPSGGRRRNCAFEAVEPSSPKVTCIGQVRVKSKKKKLQHQQQQQLRAAAAAAGVARSRSVRSVGEAASFREHSKHGSHGGYGWVHQIPVSICEALRALGEFNCFLPCSWRSFYCSETPCEEEKQSNVASSSIRHGDQKQVSSSCCAVFARWLMAVHENEDGKQRREVVGLVVGEGAKVGLLAGSRKWDKSLAEELEVVDFTNNEKKETSFAAAAAPEEEEAEEEARGSVCVPPRNALLLMRCRSDPVKMAALATRFWDSPAMRAEVLKEHAQVVEEDGANVDQYLFGSRKADEKESESILPPAAAANDHLKADTETGEAEANAAVVKETVNGEDVADGITVSASVEEEEDHGDADEEETDDHAVLVKEDVFGVNSPDDHHQLEVDKHEKVEVNPMEKNLEEEIEVKYSSLEAAEKEEVEKQEAEMINVRTTTSSCSSTSSPSMTREKLARSRSNGGIAGKGKEAAMRRSFSTKEKEKRRHSFSLEKEARRSSFSAEQTESRRASFSVDSAGQRRWGFSIDKEDIAAVQVAKHVAEEKSKSKSENNKRIIIIETEPEYGVVKPQILMTGKEQEQGVVACNKQGKAKECGGKGSQLPDCLLLMMYEPKLSMEVSKETWVCSTDFLRWRPHLNHHHFNQIHPSNEKPKKQIDQNSNSSIQKQYNENTEKVIPISEDSTLPTIKQPAKQTLTAQPPPPSGLTIKMKLQNAAAVAPLPPKPQPQQPSAGYGPFMLTRCKSEPMRSSARLAPIDVCFWKSRHQPIGAIGF